MNWLELLIILVFGYGFFVYRGKYKGYNEELKGMNKKSPDYKRLHIKAIISLVVAYMSFAILIAFAIGTVLLWLGI